MFEDLNLPLRAAPKAMPTTGLLPEAAVELILDRTGVDWLHAGHDLKQADERGARRRSGVPDGERILAIVAIKYFGGLKTGLVVGRAGLYHEHDLDRGSFGFQSWDQIALHGADSNTDTFRKSECRIGAVIYDLGLSKADQRAACDLMNEVCDLVGRPPSVGPAPAPEPSLLERPATLTAVAAPFADKPFLYVAPDIPRRKERNARKAADIPESEELIGLIDLTAFGSAKDALVLCHSGLYYKDSSNTDAPRHTTWSVVSSSEVTARKSALSRKIDIGDATFSVLGDEERLADLLHLIAAFSSRGPYIARQRPSPVRQVGQGTMTRAVSPDELADSVWRITSGRKGFLAAPDIPEGHQEVARRAAQVPGSEHIIALVCSSKEPTNDDITIVLGSAGVYYYVGSRGVAGLYDHTDSEAKPPSFESWHDVSINGLELDEVHQPGSNGGALFRFITTGRMRIFTGRQRASWQDIASVLAFTARRATGT